MTEAQKAPGLGFTLAAVVAMVGGSAMALQGHANGVLAGIVGSGIFAAFASFLGGLVILLILCLFWPGARRGLAREWRLVSRGQFPWFMLLGGIGGCSIVIAQSFTVPLFGVSIFTMSFVCGQLGGALIVDNTELPPGGKRPLTWPRLLGVAIVLAGVVVSSAGVLGQGIAWWAPLMPLCAGILTGLQQAFNGRLKAAANSAFAATFTNFLVGTIFLLLCCAIASACGTRLAGLPQLPGQWWTLLGGLLGVAFIGISTVAVAKLGVLLLSLTTLFGNLAGSLVTDVITGSADTALRPATLIAMALVFVGVGVASIPARPLGRAGRMRQDVA